MELLPGRTHTLVAALRVDAAVLTAAIIDAALVDISAVRESVQDVSFVTETLEAAGVVDAGVITGPLKGALVDVLTRAFISEQLVSFLATALKGAHRVPAEVITAAVVLLALVDIFAGFAIRLQGESHGAAAAHPCGRVLTCPVAAAVVHSAGLDAGLAVRVQSVLLVAATHRPRVCVITCVLATAVSIVTSQCTVFLVFGQLKSRTALTGYSPFTWSLSADVGTAVVLVHAVHPIIRAVDAGVLVVTEEEAICALTLIAAHGVDAHLLASAIIVQTLVHIETVVSIMGEHKSIVAGASVVSRYVDTFMDTSSIVVIFTLIHILTLFPISFVSRLADAVVGLGCVLAQSVDVAVV